MTTPPPSPHPRATQPQHQPTDSRARLRDQLIEQLTGTPASHLWAATQAAGIGEVLTELLTRLVTHHQYQTICERAHIAAALAALPRRHRLRRARLQALAGQVAAGAFAAADAPSTCPICGRTAAGLCPACAEHLRT